MQHTRPILVAHPNGKYVWQFDDGKTLPYVAGGDGDDEKKHSDADVNRMIEERLAQWKRNNPAQPPADYEDLKKAKVELDKLKADADDAAAKKLTADEATAKRIADLEKAVADSTAATAKAEADRLVEKRRSAIVASAATLKALKPAQVAALLDLEAKHKDAVTIGDDGQVTGAEEAVKAFLADNPHLVGDAKTTPASRHQGKDGTSEVGAAGKAEAARRFPAAAGAGAAQQK